MRTEDRKARKKHPCDGWYWINEYKDHCIKEQRDYKCKGISAGDEYRAETYSDGGELHTFKSCLPCLALAKKHDIPLEQL